MKLVKDYFIQKEIIDSEKNIKINILNFIQQNNLSLGTNKYSSSNLSLYPKGTNNSYTEEISNIPHYINNNLYIASNIQQGNRSKGSFHVQIPQGNSKLYLYLFNNSKTEIEKKVLVKTVFHDMLSKSNFFDELHPKLNTEDYWFHLRNFIPFFDASKSVNDARKIFSSLQNKSIDTDEKINALLYTIQFYKQICKRSDVQGGLVKTILSKVDDDKISIFEDFLKIKIQYTQDYNSIFEEEEEVVSLTLNKDQTFQQISFPNIPQARVDNYNRFLTTINDFLTSSNVKPKLNISNIDFVEFSSKKNPSRIYITSNRNGFKENIKEIYLHLLTSCNSKLIEGWKQEHLKESLETSLNFYLLNKSINKNNINEQQKNKSLKI